MDIASTHLFSRSPIEVFKRALPQYRFTRFSDSLSVTLELASPSASEYEIWKR